MVVEDSLASLLVLIHHLMLELEVTLFTLASFV